MADQLTKQISDVRKEISELFSSNSSPVLPIFIARASKLPEITCKPKILNKLSKPKEYLSLPNISVHRNPMSLISVRETIRHKLNKKKRIV